MKKKTLIWTILLSVIGMAAVCGALWLIAGQYSWLPAHLMPAAEVTASAGTDTEDAEKTIPAETATDPDLTDASAAADEAVTGTDLAAPDETDAETATGSDLAEDPAAADEAITDAEKATGTDLAVDTRAAESTAEATDTDLAAVVEPAEGTAEATGTDLATDAEAADSTIEATETDLAGETEAADNATEATGTDLADADESVDAASGPWLFSEADGAVAISGYRGDDVDLVLPTADDRGRPVTAVAEDAFAGNTGLVSVTFPREIKTIGARAFAGCTSLNEVKLTSVTTVGDSAFEGCTALRYATVADGYWLRSIGARAFAGCTNLYALHVGVPLVMIGEDAFADCPHFILHIHNNYEIIDYCKKNRIYWFPEP